MSYLWCIDHDGTASFKDIGRDYLCGLVGLDSNGFIEEVKKIRNDLEYRKKILRGEKYESGLELALLLVYHGVSQDDVRRNGRKAKNSLRDGFTEFLNDPKRGRVIIFSAGVKDWLINYYMKNFPNINFDVVGTTLHVDENGRYSRIKKSCGRESKPERIKEVLYGMNNDIIKIGVGDSQNDIEMFNYVLEDIGLTIGIGYKIKGDINFPEETKWYPIWEVGKLYVEKMRSTKNDLIKKKEKVLEQIRENIEKSILRKRISF